MKIRVYSMKYGLYFHLIVAMLNAASFCNGMCYNGIRLWHIWLIMAYWPHMTSCMACHLLGAGPFPEPMRTYCQLKPWEPALSENLHFLKSAFKMSANGRPLFSGLNVFSRTIVLLCGTRACYEDWFRWITAMRGPHLLLPRVHIKFNQLQITDSLAMLLRIVNHMKIKHRHWALERQRCLFSAFATQSTSAVLVNSPKIWVSKLGHPWFR